MSGRDCSFASEPRQGDLKSSASDQSCQDGSLLSPGDCQESVTATSLSVSTPNGHEPSFDNVVNMEHMELLVHLITNKDLFSLGDKFEDFQPTFDICIKKSIKAPYLLHQVLAFSARHLAVIHPERSANYLGQAIGLQTRAVSLFNSTKRHVDASNCVSILLFSVTLGHHLLADALASRDPGGLDEFLGQYVQCVDMNRGIYNVVVSAWPLLVDSELEPILSWSRGQSAKDPVGNHCDPVLQLIKDSNSLNDTEKEVCREATEYLQVGFDAMVLEKEGEESNRYRMIFQWTMLSSPEFTKLLTAKQPEALILLGYYALLLHYGRNLWQVKDTGAYLLGLIVEYLSPEWHFWLGYPRRMLRYDAEV
jgi:hypothetical protein